MIVSLFACFITISNHHMTPARKNGIHTSNECTSDKWNACSPFPYITKCWFKQISSVLTENEQVPGTENHICFCLIKGSVHPNHKNYFFSPLLIKIVLVYFSQFSRSVSKRSVSAPKQWRWTEFFTKHLPTPKLTILQIMLLCFSIVNDFSYMHLFISIK